MGPGRQRIKQIEADTPSPLNPLMIGQLNARNISVV